MGADYYIETHALVKFKDASKASEKFLLKKIPSWADYLIDGQILKREIIYKNNGWVYNINYNLINHYRINLLEVETIEEIMSVLERF